MTLRQITKIAVFCGSNTGNDPTYSQIAMQLMECLADAGITLVYGGAKSGLMGILADHMLKCNGHDLSEKVWAYLKQEKFFAMVIPREYGGRGFSALAHSTIVTKIATHSISAAVTTMVPNSLGPGELLVHYGTEAQKQHYLPRLARGEEIPCGQVLCIEQTATT